MKPEDLKEIEHELDCTTQSSNKVRAYDYEQTQQSEQRQCLKREDLKEIRKIVDEELLSVRIYLIVIWILVAITLALSAHASEIPADYANRIADAIYVAEGGAKAKVPYGILSVRVRDKTHAREVCLRTIRANWRRWEDAGRKEPYLEFLARRYAPVGAKNDPKGLNMHWLRNVKANLTK